MYRSRSSDDSGVFALIGCVVQLVLVGLVFYFGGVCVNYLLAFFVHKTIPLFWAMVLSLFTAELSTPVAIILWILVSTGILSWPVF